jgi:RNA polymerase sigma factor (sigma-70 family)
LDNYLIYLVQSYNKEALKLLIEKYRKIMLGWTRELISLRSLGQSVDISLILNDLDAVLFKTIETYDESKGIFYSYLKGAVHNTVMNYLRNNQRIIATTVSLEKEINDDMILQDSIPSNDNMSLLEERYDFIEEVEDLINKINKFKEKDRKIIYLRMQGYTCIEISKMTKTNIRNINYLTRKIKNM